jgi:carboxyl-terminal processing protease
MSLQQREFRVTFQDQWTFPRLSKFLLMAGWILLAACSSSTPSTPTSVASEPSPLIKRQLQIFDEVDTALKEHYIYADFGGVDWGSLSADFRARIELGIRDDEFYSGLSNLVEQLPLGTASFALREERISADIEETELYEGIGAFITYRSEPAPHIVILSVIVGSPAESAGLQAHDSIYAIDGIPVSTNEGISAVERIRGPRGSTVLLEVVTPNEGARQIRVTRERVLAADVPRGGVFESGIYYLLVPVNADPTLLTALEEAFRQIEADDLSGLILDLRIAHSTTEWPIGELLVALTEGQLGTLFTRTQQNVIGIVGQDVAGSQSVPLAVLIGPETSGTPEIFASAVGEIGRATIIGMPTPGNVLGFEQVTLLDGSFLIFSASSYETISGVDLAQTGVAPEILIEVDWDQVTLATDPVILMAIETLLDDSQP